jgi:hypothetical protein
MADGASVSHPYALDDAAPALEDFTHQHTLGTLVITVP